jgi:hypothetical protein
MRGMLDEVPEMPDVRAFKVPDRNSNSGTSGTIETAMIITIRFQRIICRTGSGPHVEPNRCSLAPESEYFAQPRQARNVLLHANIGRIPTTGCNVLEHLEAP